jgi:hypothetical protein
MPTFRSSVAALTCRLALHLTLPAVAVAASLSENDDAGALRCARGTRFDPQ